MFLARPCIFKNYKLCRNHFGPSYGFLITVPCFYINSFLLALLWLNTSNEWNSHTWIYFFFPPLEGTLAHVKWNLPSWPLWNLFSTPVTVLEYKRRIIEGSEPDASDKLLISTESCCLFKWQTHSLHDTMLRIKPTNKLPMNARTISKRTEAISSIHWMKLDHVIDFINPAKL